MDKIPSWFHSAFRIDLDEEEVAGRLKSAFGLSHSAGPTHGATTLVSGVLVDGTRVEISRKSDDGVAGLAISPPNEDAGACASAYFELREQIHASLWAALVITDVMQEIRATRDAGRKELHLTELDLRALPPEIGTLTELEWLEVSRNKLTHLPREIGLLTKLVELDVSDNGLMEIPAEVGRLTDLTTLVIAGNRIEHLPAELGLLTQLERLEAQRNQLTELPPEIGRLVNLRYLWVQGNRLTRLPAELQSLEKLRDWDFTKKRLPPRHPWGLMASDNPLVYPPLEVVKKGSAAVREFLRNNPVRYKVFVDDNYHPHDETYRYRLGEFDDFPSAVAACRKMVDEFLATSKAATAQEMFESYQRFGEDPFIQSTDTSCVFSAWEYAKRRCEEIVKQQSPYQVTLDKRSGVRRLTGLFEVINDSEIAMERRLKDAFPELKWENLAENWGKIRLLGTSSEKPPEVSISVSRNESPGPFHLVIVIRSVSLEHEEESYRALHARVTAALL